MFAVVEQYEFAALFVLFGIFFDFFDGLAARLLKVHSKLGMELDSLADLVTSCVVPGIIMYKLIENSLQTSSFAPRLFEKNSSLLGPQAEMDFSLAFFLPFFGLFLTLAGAYRLAKFNLDERQSDAFIGLPVPAMALFVLSLPLLMEYSDMPVVHELLSSAWFLLCIVVLFSFLMNAELPLFSLKFKKKGAFGHFFPLLLIGLTIALALWVKLLAIPITILLYVLLSLVQNTISKPKIS